ncbi:hypothetical protein MANES_11G060028v8, partial [Manihot esculenta]
VVILWIQIHGNKCCFEEERLALLDLKAFVGSNGFDADHLLPSWIDTTSNCCEWEHVICNSTTGHVTELSLNNTRQYNLESDSFCCERLSKLKKLEVLDLTWNKFNNIILPSLGTLISLKTLILGSNSMEGSFPIQELKNLKNLTCLDISRNNFNGALLFKELKNLKSLEFLDISYNSFNSTLSIKEFLTFKRLEILNLKGNTFAGCISKDKLSNLKILKTLDVSYNQFNSSLSAAGLCGLKSLVELNLRGNQFSGPLPECIGNLTNLQFLDLSFNQLSGNIQSIVSELTSLKYLLLSGNEFEGSFSFSALANHSKLEAFILSPGNSRLEVETENPTWFPAFQLKYIQLSNCNLNVRTRAIPSFLRYQHSIRFIDLSHNKLVGTFPSWILQNNSILGVINLKNNSFTGTFQLPNIKHGLVVLDILSNNLTGPIPRLLCHLTDLVFLDISCNELSGSIPQEIGDLHEIRSLNLSHNHITGSIPVSFSNLRSLESLDLGNNNLSGEIPSELVGLTFLETFNVSYNNLSDRVPDGAQFGTFDENNYRGNPGLCGEPIHKSCKSDEVPQTPPPSADVEEEDEGGIDMV